MGLIRHSWVSVVVQADDREFNRMGSACGAARSSNMQALREMRVYS